MHVRLPIATLKADQILTAVRNVVDLLGKTTRTWWLESMRALTPVLDCSKRTPEDTQEIFKEEEDVLRGWYAEDGNPGVPLMMVL